MLYAKVVLGLPVEGPFDYIVPLGWEKKVKVGLRAWVDFCSRKMVGYIVALSETTSIKNLKKISDIIDDYPVIDRNLLSLTKEVSSYYCCSWGEAIETAIPENLRKGKKAVFTPAAGLKSGNGEFQTLLVHDLDGEKRWAIYIERIKGQLKNGKSTIILFPDLNSVLKAKEKLENALGEPLAILYRNKPEEFKEWLKIKEGASNIVIGMRSCIFAPVRNLGLIIIDEEQDPVYKQEQVPHYHCREVAFMLQKITKASLILASSAPSLESFYLAKKNKIRYLFTPRIKDYPEIKTIERGFLIQKPGKGGTVFSRYLQDSIISCLSQHGKVLLFLNRKGFATACSCPNCGVSLKCPHCNINLVFYFKENILKCHHCNFTMPPPKICPHCNSHYIRYSGLGTEKLESELSRLFPQARVARITDKEKLDIQATDIFISTSYVIGQAGFNFDLIMVLGIDNSLNRPELRASEKTYDLLAGLLRLTDKKMIIETQVPGHHCVQSLLKKDVHIFYEEELKQRKQLYFPPYRHTVLIKLRGSKEDRAKETSYRLFEKINKHSHNKNIRIISVNPAMPSKLRGNFYWQLLISSANVRKACEFLKINLKNFLHSGIIVTVDVDPV